MQLCCKNNFGQEQKLNLCHPPRPPLYSPVFYFLEENDVTRVDPRARLCFPETKLGKTLPYKCPLMLPRWQPANPPRAHCRHN